MYTHIRPGPARRVQWRQNIVQPASTPSALEMLKRLLNERNVRWSYDRFS